MSKRQLGGLQKQAISLYRQVLRAAREKPSEGGGRQSIESLARSQFDQYRGIQRKEFIRIEHLLRRGQRQLELLRKSDVTGVQMKAAAGAPDGSPDDQPRQDSDIK